MVGRQVLALVILVRIQVPEVWEGAGEHNEKKYTTFTI